MTKTNIYKICIFSLFMEKRFVITKKVAKHGKQAVIIVPRMLEEASKARDCSPGYN